MNTPSMTRPWEGRAVLWVVRLVVRETKLHCWWFCGETPQYIEKETFVGDREPNRQTDRLRGAERIGTDVDLEKTGEAAG